MMEYVIVVTSNKTQLYLHRHYKTSPKIFKLIYFSQKQALCKFFMSPFNFCSFAKN